RTPALVDAALCEVTLRRRSDSPHVCFGPRARCPSSGGAPHPTCAGRLFPAFAALPPPRLALPHACREARAPQPGGRGRTAVHSSPHPQAPRANRLWLRRPPPVRGKLRRGRTEVQ